MNIKSLTFMIPALAPFKFSPVQKCPGKWLPFELGKARLLLGYNLFPAALLAVNTTLGSVPAVAACVTTGTAVTCSNIFIPAGFPIDYTNAGVLSVNLDSTFDGTAVDSNGVQLRDTSAAGTSNLTVTMDDGAILDRTGTGADAIFVQNRGTGSNTVNIAGEINSDQRGVRLQATGNSPTDIDTVIIAETGRITSGQTAIWLRHSSTPGVSMGAVNIDVAGILYSASVRGIHVSANGPTNSSPVNVRVRETGVVRSDDQAIYVGNAGPGLVHINIEGQVIGGQGPDLGNFGPTAAIILDTEAGGSRIDIAATGVVSSLNDKAIVDLDTGSNSSVTAVVNVINSGRLTGFVELGGGDDAFTNNGTWSFRNWADTTGDGARDTVGTAIADFGTGADTLVNTGTIEISNVDGSVKTVQFVNLESFINNGVLTSRDGIAGDQISVSGNYSGTGSLLFDVNFATDTPDTLVILGDVTGGTTSISVAGITSGPVTGNNIALIDVTGTTITGDFSLAGGQVFAGAYAYDLDLLGNQWTLVSQLSGASAIYESAPSILFDALASLPTLEQRTGQRQWLDQGNLQTGLRRPAHGLWARITGKYSNITPLISDTGASYRSSSWGLQLGIDFPAIKTSYGRWVFGATGQAGTTSATISNASGGGDINSLSYGFGGTATWYGTGGGYVDVQAKLTRINMDVTGDAQGKLVNGVGINGQAASLEAGYRFALNNTLSLVPQAQLIAGRLGRVGFEDRSGRSVKFKSSESLVSRFGVAYEMNVNQDKIYAIANLFYDFSKASTVDVAGISLISRKQRKWAEFGVGANIRLDGNILLYTQTSYRTALGGANRQNNTFAFTAGLDVQF